MKNLLTFNPDEAFALIERHLTDTKLKLPNDAVCQVLMYLIENMDINMAYAASFWEPIALKRFAVNTSTLPAVLGLNQEQSDFILNLLKPLGLILFNVIFRAGLFKTKEKDSFPYIVRSVANGLVILED